MKRFLKCISCLLMLSLLISVFSLNVNAEDLEVDRTRYSERVDGLRQYEVAVEDEKNDSNVLFEAGRKSLSIDTAYWKKLGTDYYYNTLTADEKVIWDNMENSCLEALDNTKDYQKMPKIANSAGVSLERLKDIAWMFRYSNPQYYFLGEYLWYSQAGSYCYFEVYDIFQDGDARKQYTEKFRSTVDAWTAQVAEGTYDENKEAIAHDLIAKNTVYAANSYDQSAYSVFCLGRTVCTGYASAMTILCNAVGIECITLTSANHAWNNINLHGNWYLVDVTWDDDDNSDSVIYLFYNKSNETIQSLDEDDSHATEGMWSSSPNCMFDSNLYVYSYAPSYVADDRYVYFFVNDNDEIGPSILKIVDTLNGASVTDAPKKISISGYPYAVTTASSIDVQQFVDRLYRILLNRSAELGGISAWTMNLMASESTSAEIVYGIMFSDEFKNRGLSYADGIECLYQAMLGRGSDEAGKNAWLQNMNNGMTYTSLINGFAGSQEFSNICAEYGISAGDMEITEPRDMNSDVTAFVARCYREALLREADEDGLNSWCTVMLSGEESPKEIAKGFVFSPEVVDSNLSDGDFIKLLYRLCMGREYDEVGFNGWSEVLANGGTREEVFWGFADSPEFEEIIAGFGL